MSTEPQKIRDFQSESSLQEALKETIDCLRATQRGSDQLRTLERFQAAYGQSKDNLTEQFSFKALSDEQTLFTGYFLPHLKGSLTKSPDARFPIYANHCTSATRKEIDSDGVLAGKNLEIAWVADALELFFVHIQGYGLLELADGSKKHLRVSGHNNHTYYPIGKHLIEKGVFKKEEVSAQKIINYLREHPQSAQDILNLNPRYIFFRIEERGPIGELGAPLIPMRSLACDWKHFPPGSLCYLELDLPTFDSRGDCTGSKHSSFFAINHDIGSAITGTQRIDLYCGSGEQAWFTAGHLKHHGRAYLVSAKE